MRFFPKLLLLLTAIALVPLSAVTLYEWTATQRLSSDISEHAGDLLTKEATAMLAQAVESYARLVKEQARTLETIVTVQAREMERLLAEGPPAAPEVYFSEAYDQGAVPGLVAASQRYDRVGDDGNVTTGRISLEHAEFKLAPDVDRETVAGDIARLAKMTAIYRTFFEKHSNILVFLYTATESGVFSSYPGMGGFPEDYDPRLTYWYRKAKNADGLVWNPPAVDAAGMGVLAGVSMPVRWPDGSVAGITAIDAPNIQELPSTLPNAPWAANLQVFLTHVDPRQDANEPKLLITSEKDYHKELKDWRTPFQKTWLESEDQQTYRRMVQAILEGKSGALRMPYQGRDSLWAYGLISKGNAALVFIVPMENVVANARLMGEFIFKEEYHELAIIGAIALLAVAIVVLFSLVGSRSIAAPLRALAKATDEIAAGNLDARIPEVSSQDEVGDLTHAVASMQGDLKRYIADLTEAAGARERIESELRIAREIQMSFLPRAFPQPPRGNEFNVFAAIQPAREVGGDLYDVFLIDDSSLFFAIGDVSGKGIPAALFMAKTKTMLKGITREQRVPHKILTAMNTELGQGNDTCMFVTFFCGILNTGTGEILFCNAGHNPPLLLRKQEEATFLQPEKTLMLGVFEESRYYTERILLGPGDSLFLYTDGVTEATTEDNEFYSAARLQKAISSFRELSPEETIAGLTNELRSFCGPAPQADDITMLMIRFNGPC